ncbi:MAG: LacI family DNA-binding transcriptional regulator [Clostridia bacterium]|nr:LacI family DNA-binding transcriptional regulator [Clostridia bacterium]
MNLKDIAQMAGVSTATVSRVINQSGPVSPDTYQKVLKIIEKQGYVPDTIAKSLRIGQTKTIGFVVPDISNPFFPEVLNGAEAVCAGYGYNIILGNTNEDIATEEKVVRSLRQQRADGLLMILVDESGGTLSQALLGADPDLPIVFIDRHIERFRYDSVVIDNEAGVAQAVEHLVGLGHSRISIIHGPVGTTPGLGRLKGYRKAMKAAGIPHVEEYVAEGDFRIRSGYELAGRLMSLPVPPTAIIGGNNLMTMGIFQRLNDMAVSIPDQVSLIGFDDFPLAANLTPAITVVDRPTCDMGRIAADLLLSRVEKRDQSAVRKVVLPTKLKIRNSCRNIVGS